MSVVQCSSVAADLCWNVAMACRSSCSCSITVVFSKSRLRILSRTRKDDVWRESQGPIACQCSYCRTSEYISNNICCRIAPTGLADQHASPLSTVLCFSSYSSLVLCIKCVIAVAETFHYLLLTRTQSLLCDTYPTTSAQKLPAPTSAFICLYRVQQQQLVFSTSPSETDVRSNEHDPMIQLAMSLYSAVPVTAL